MGKFRAASLLSLALVAASVGGAAAQAEDHDAMSGPGSELCLDHMRQMMAMMSEHMGTGTMDEDASPVPGMMAQGSSMDGGMMGREAGVDALPDDRLALMDQMMAMMSAHMGAPVMGIDSDEVAPAPDHGSADEGSTDDAATASDGHDAHHPDAMHPPSPPRPLSASR